MSSKLLRKLFCILLFFSVIISCSAKSENKKIDIFIVKADVSANDSKKDSTDEKTADENSKDESSEKKESTGEEELSSDKIKKITVELAISSEEQQRGFMERQVIPEGTGMIFLYKKDRKMHFWMKNTPHPLSIAYIDSSGKIREIYDMKPYSLETVSSIHSCRYALEVPQGMFKRLGIEVGDLLTTESLLLIKRQFY